MSPFYDPSKTRCPEIGPKWGSVEVAARAMALLDTKCLLEIFLLLYISCQKVCRDITSCIKDQWPALSQSATKTPSAINKLSTQLFSLFSSRFSPTNISDVQGPRRGIGKRALGMSLFWVAGGWSLVLLCWHCVKHFQLVLIHLSHFMWWKYFDTTHIGYKLSAREEKSIWLVSIN